uniref:Derlin n=1 Tax=Odontella aurita TaxID=265563 RepID=A0A6U6GRJ3_9STRA|mmetsp:Transcript_43495/g.132350  ORF Transcript_43495/g.132350 Transcript_43495/m.132350 type:complete len:328 (+) Transcript_43495:179-1162(+)
MRFSYMAALLAALACCIAATPASAVAPVLPGNVMAAQPSMSERLLLDIRGGAKARRRTGKRTASLSSLGSEKKTATGKKAVGATKETPSAISDTMQKYKAILPLTRIYITMIGVVTLMGLVLGEELAQGVLALDPIRVMYGLELWRPFTAACFLGPPSIGWLMSAYYLFEYGSSLERAYGTAQHLVFLIWQIVLLTVLSAFFGQPFFAQPVITAMLHVLSRSMPKQKVKWLIFNVPYWSLPYGLMASDVLQAQSPMAALPHIMGILTGHFYFFYKFIWPKMGGEDWLTAPDFLSQWLDPNARSDSKKSVNAALKARKKGKGRKLGGK